MSTKKWTVSTSVEGQYFFVRFKWKLPLKEDASAIRELTYDAEGIVSKAGGTVGQMNAVSKDLRTAGFYIKDPKSDVAMPSEGFPWL